MTFYFTKSIGLVAVMTTLMTTVQGGNASEGGIPSYYIPPISAMPWGHYNPVSPPNYPISGPYPMAHFVNSFHVLPNTGMPWVTGVCPNCTTMRFPEPMYSVPIVNRVYEQFPISGTPWRFPPTVGLVEPISGPYPMADYVNNLPLYPLSGMPWINSMNGL